MVQVDLPAQQASRGLKVLLDQAVRSGQPVLLARQVHKASRASREYQAFLELQARWGRQALKEALGLRGRVVQVVSTAEQKLPGD